MNNIYEVFMDIKGYEGIYQVSNLGRVRNSKGKIMKQHKKNDGYMTIDLYKDGKRKTHKVHRLVAITFIPNPENKRTVNHKDEVKTNNHVDNLEWMTTAENNSYGTRTARAIAKLSKQVYCITNNTVYASAREAARKLNLDNANINKCLKGKYKQTKGYQFKYYTEGDLL